MQRARPVETIMVQYNELTSSIAALNEEKQVRPNLPVRRRAKKTKIRTQGELRKHERPRRRRSNRFLL